MGLWEQAWASSVGMSQPIGRLDDGREIYVRIDPNGDAPAGPPFTCHTQVPALPVSSSRSEATSIVRCSIGSSTDRTALRIPQVEWVSTRVKC